MEKESKSHEAKESKKKEAREVDCMEEAKKMGCKMEGCDD